MNDDEAGLPWRAFNLNWLSIAAVGALLLSAIICSGFSLEPIVSSVTMAVGLSLALIAYVSAMKIAEPQLTFSLGAIGQRGSPPEIYPHDKEHAVRRRVAPRLEHDRF